MMRLTRELDTKTLRYDWFLSNDGTRCEVREGYVDADGDLYVADAANNRVIKAETAVPYKDKDGSRFVLFRRGTITAG